MLPVGALEVPEVRLAVLHPVDSMALVVSAVGSAETSILRIYSHTHLEALVVGEPREGRHFSQPYSLGRTLKSKQTYLSWMQRKGPRKRYLSRRL